jgi:aryl-alcohol dehydrogenase-like predicted oxidoreductase
MDMRPLGSLQVSVVGLGTNNFGFTMAEEDVAPVVDAAIDAGINFFDTADSYLESEARLGRALGSRRDQVLLATKFASKVGDSPGGAAPDYIRRAVERSLTQLGTDRIDLYQIHRPDPSTPIADTLGALAELVDAGKVREIGCSNFDAAQLEEAAAAVGPGKATFVSVQNHYNLLERADAGEVLPACRRLGLGYVPYFPLASGVLTGKYRRGESPAEGTRLHKWGERAQGNLNDRTFALLDDLGKFCADRGHTLTDLAFAWLLAQSPVTSVIAGATSPDQVRANAAAGGWSLSSTDRAEVDQILARHS